MQMMRNLTIVVLLSFALGLSTNAKAQATADPLHVLVVTGGHAFETNLFFNLFKTNTAFSCQFAERADLESSFAPSNKWDAIVLYELQPEAQR